MPASLSYQIEKALIAIVKQQEVIAVQEMDIVASGYLNAPISGGRDPLILLMEDPDVIKLVGIAIGNRTAIIGRAIVNDDDFDTVAGQLLPQRRFQTTFKASVTIIYGNNYRKFHNDKDIRTRAIIKIAMKQ